MGNEQGGGSEGGWEEGKGRKGETPSRERQGLACYPMHVGGTVADVRAQSSAIEALLRHVGASPDVVPRRVPPAPRKYAFASAQSDSSLVTESAA